MKIKSTISILMFALLISAGAVTAEGSSQQNERELSPTLNQGLDRDRASYRARMMEERRLEDESKHVGAGLDRQRAQMRAEKLEKRRHEL